MVYSRWILIICLFQSDHPHILHKRDKATVPETLPVASVGHVLNSIRTVHCVS